MKGYFVAAFLILLFISNAPVKSDRNGAQANTAGNLKSESSLKKPDDAKDVQSGGNLDPKAPKWYACVEWSNWFLVVIAGLTGVAICVQAREMRRVTVLTQRPVLRVRNIAISIPEVRKSSEPQWQVSFDIANAGGTPAEVVVSHCIGGRFAKLPMRRPFETATPNSPIEVGTKIRPGESVSGISSVDASEFQTSVYMAKDPDHYKSPAPYYLMGVVRYKDKLNIFREVVFCRKFDYDKDRFFPVDDPDYEYAD